MTQPSNDPDLRAVLVLAALALVVALLGVFTVAVPELRDETAQHADGGTPETP